MMEAHDIDERHLRLHQEKVAEAFELLRQQLEQWEKFEDDYLKVNERLRTLPDRTTHEVMVPFGKVAFLPGRLVHTNELLVLLGDNWFAERSAKQAQEIVQRRLQYVADKKAGVQQQIDGLLARESLSHELAGDFGEDDDGNPIVEIVEPVSDDAPQEISRHRDPRKAHTPVSAARGAPVRDLVIEREPLSAGQHEQGGESARAKSTEGETRLPDELAAEQILSMNLTPHQDVYVAEQEKSLTMDQLWAELDKLEEAERSEIDTPDSKTGPSTSRKSVSFADELEIQQPVPRSSYRQSGSSKEAQTASAMGSGGLPLERQREVPFSGGIVERTDDDSGIDQVSRDVKPASHVSRFKAARSGK